MLKLMNFPRGSNRNRPLKDRMPALSESPRQVERIFRRFWREYRRTPPLKGEEEACA